LSIKAQRAEHLRIKISVMSFKIVAQMLSPYGLAAFLKIIDR
jgi:hypothetical protein